VTLWEKENPVTKEVRRKQKTSKDGETRRDEWEKGKKAHAQGGEGTKTGGRSHKKRFKGEK